MELPANKLQIAQILSFAWKLLSPLAPGEPKRLEAAYVENTTERANLPVLLLTLWKTHDFFIISSHPGARLD